MGSEWTEAYLTELYDISSGLSKPAKDFGTGFPFLSFKDVFYNTFVPNTLDQLVQTSQTEQEKCSVKAGDVFLTRTSETMNELGMSCVALKHYPNATFNGFSKRLRPKKENNLVHEYVAYYLRSPKFRNEMLAFSTMSTRASLNNEMIGRLKIQFPSVAVQHYIANILKTLDNKITLNRQLNQTLENMAQALFKSWFVDFDPVIDNALAAGNAIPDDLQDRAERRQTQRARPNHIPLLENIRKLFPNKFELTETLGWVPKGWRVVDLKSLTSKIGSGATPRGGKQVYKESGTSIIRSQNVYDSVFTWDGLAYISDEAANQLKNVTVCEGDILLNITGASILRTCVVNPEALPARVNQHVAIIRAKKGIPSRYLHLHLLHPSTKNHLLSQNAGASREAITKGHIENVPTLSPDTKILARFEEFTSPLYIKIDQIFSNIRVLTNLRDTLLPKLISGELRIPEAEQLVAEVLA